MSNNPQIIRKQNLLSAKLTEQTIACFESNGQFGSFEKYPQMPEFLKVFLPELLKRISVIDKRLKLTAEPFTLTKFFRVCEAENITVNLEKLPKHQAKIFTAKKGMYMVNPKTLESFIWIKPGLAEDFRLFVMAHEISHHCLHRESMIYGFKRYPWFQKPKGISKRPIELLMAEVEADLLASLLLSVGGGK